MLSLSVFQLKLVIVISAYSDKSQKFAMYLYMKLYLMVVVGRRSNMRVYVYVQTICNFHVI